MQAPVLVIHNRAEDFRAELQARFPDLKFVYAQKGQEVIPALEAHQPEVVFSIKQPIFPAQYHRPVLDWPSVCWVQVGGAGFEHFDPWDASRLTLTNASGLLAPFLAETVIGVLIGLNHGLFVYRDQQKAHLYRARGFKPLAGQTLAVVGLGNIGSLVAKNAQALGLKVLGIRTRAEEHPFADEVQTLDRMAEVIGRADAVSLHVRLTPQTENLINGPMLAAMKPGALLLNASRGTVVNEEALIQALQSGRLAGAWLDVFRTEPLPPDSPLWELPNLFISPHAADMAVDWTVRFARFFMDNLERYLAGQPLLKVVKPDKA